MSNFSYTALTKDGEKRKGHLEAVDSDDLLKKLKSQELFCLSYKQLDNAKPTSHRQLKYPSLISFCSQFGSLLAAGISVSRSLDIMYQSVDNKRTKAVIAEIIENVNKGVELSMAIRSLGKAFPPITAYMVETGETSGRLSEAFTELSAYFERESTLKNKIQTALIYPILLGGVSIAAVIFMMVYVLPSFVSLYTSDILPLPTRIMISISDFLREHGLLLLGIIVVLIIALVAALQKPKVKIAFKRWQLSLPLIGKLLRTTLTARFSDVFSILFSSGIQMVNCLDIAAKVTSNIYVQSMVSEAIVSVSSGKSLHESLSETGVFDNLFLSMVQVGEEASSLDKMMKQTSEFFDKQATASIMKFIALLEPAMIIFLGLIVGFIVIAMIVPIFNSYSQML